MREISSNSHSPVRPAPQVETTPSLLENDLTDWEVRWYKYALRAVLSHREALEFIDNSSVEQLRFKCSLVIYLLVGPTFGSLGFTGIFAGLILLVDKVPPASLLPGIEEIKFLLTFLLVYSLLLRWGMRIEFGVGWIPCLLKKIEGMIADYRRQMVPTRKD